MLESLEGFTAQDSQRINELIANDFEGATKEDIELYTSWKTALNIEDKKFKQQYELAQKEQQARAQALEKMANDSANALNEIVSILRNKYKG